MTYSSRITNLQESATIAISTLATTLKAQGRDILSFSAGEPDFDTPEPIKLAAKAALDEGFTKYTQVAGIPELKQAIANKLERENGLCYEPKQILVSNGAKQSLFKGFTKYTQVAGIPELKQAIANKLERENGLCYEPKQILVSNGAKQSLFNVFQALIDTGDEVIIPSPYWVTYPELVAYSGGSNVFIETNEQNGFKITAKSLRQAITPRTKALVLTTPSNPTGMVYTKQELESIAQVLHGSDIVVIADEMYEKLLYDGEFVSVGSISQDMFERTITINGLSKSVAMTKLLYDGEFVSVGSISQDMFERTITINGLSKSVAMTGWRMGYCASADTTLIKLMTNLQSQCTSNINSITQKASIIALEGGVDTQIEAMRQAFLARRDLAVSSINAIQGLHTLSPQGAFYLFISIGSACGGDSMAFCKQLLEQEGIALVPGSAFGADGFVRLSFACSTEQITAGIARIAHFMFCKQLLEQEGIALVPGSAFGADGFVRLSFACSTEQITAGIARIAHFMQGLV